MPAALTPVDRWLLSLLGRTIARVTGAFDSYELLTARSAIEGFFWSDFCDTYLELVKHRLTQSNDTASRAAAVHTMRAALLAVLKMLAPFLPHITEEIYVQAFAEADGAVSVHVSAWPDATAYPADAEAERLGETMLAIVESVRRWKAARNLSVGAPLPELTITSRREHVPSLREIEPELRSITRAKRIVLLAGDTLEVVLPETQLAHMPADSANETA